MTSFESPAAAAGRWQFAAHDHGAVLQATFQAQHQAVATHPELGPALPLRVEGVQAHARQATCAAPVLVQYAAAGLTRNQVVPQHLLAIGTAFDLPFADPEIELAVLR